MNDRDYDRLSDLRDAIVIAVQERDSVGGFKAFAAYDDFLRSESTPLDRERLALAAQGLVAAVKDIRGSVVEVIPEREWVALWNAYDALRAALAQPTEANGLSDVDRMRAAARRARLPREVSVADIENLAREYGHACCSGCDDTGHCTHGYEVAQPTEDAE